MEGVGARLGRSSTRYGPTSTVFNGPVRKWKKKWVHVSPPSNNSSSNHHHHNNGSNGSHLLLYKWTPISQSRNNNTTTNGDKTSAVDDGAAAEAEEERPRRKFRYIPIAVLEEQINEAAEKVEDETKPSDADSNLAQPTSKNDGFDEKPDMNDVPMEEESQPPNDTALARQDLNESTLDLSLGLNAHDGDPDPDMKTDRSIDS